MPRSFVVVAVIIASIGFVLTSPETAERCAAGDALKGVGAYAAALKEYEAALDSEPFADCAAEGVKAVADARCSIATQLEARGQGETATGLYKSLAEGNAGSCFTTLAGTETHTCDTGDALLHRGLLSSAQKTYQELLTRQPSPRCALEGLAQITQARCTIIDDLQAKDTDNANALALQKILVEGDPGSCFEPKTQKT